MIEALFKDVPRIEKASIILSLATVNALSVGTIVNILKSGSVDIPVLTDNDCVELSTNSIYSLNEIRKNFPKP